MREESVLLTKLKIRNSKSGKEIAEAITAHFKSYGAPKHMEVLSDVFNSTPLFSWFNFFDISAGVVNLVRHITKDI